MWSNDAFAPKLKTVIAVCDEKAYKVSSDDSVSVKMTKVPELQSSQEETGTRVVLYCNYAADNDYDYVKVRSPDSDIFSFSYIMQQTWEYGFCLTLALAAKGDYLTLLN